MADPDDREMLQVVSETYGRVAADSAARARLKDRIRHERRSGWAPTSRALQPSWAFALALAMVLLGFGMGWAVHARWAERGKDSAVAELARIRTTREVRLVQFVIDVPGASRVAVVGDFNDWDRSATPMRRDEDGAWVVAIPLAPGRHVYAFVIDGRRWVPDPSAPLAPEQDFGTSNSVIVVGGSEPT